jgi:uncharacterized membrane protein
VLIVLPIPLLRVPLGLALALLAPGYCLTAALFPRRDDLDGVARITLSFGLSIAVLPALALLLSALPWGIQPQPMAISLAVWMLLLCGVALWRRHVLARSGQMDALAAAELWSWWWGQRDHSRTRCAIGGLVLGGTLIAGVTALLAFSSTPHLTEFYTLGAAGLAQDYPREVAPGEEMELLVGITNHEGTRAEYRVEVRAAGLSLTQIGPITLEDGASWEQPVRYTLVGIGDNQRIDVLLFYKDTATPYRQLQLWVNVRPKPS